MCSQNLENSYQVIAMNESESMSLHEESQANHFSPPPEDSFSESLKDIEEQEDQGEEREDVHMVGDSSLEGKDFPKKKNQREEYSIQFDNFKKLFEEQADPEAKLQLAIQFMEASLAQGGMPHFRSFWEARRLCLPLFKENISPMVRSQLWTKYSELSKEARRLKEILDEQSAFAVEQIEIAIQALENDIAQFDTQVEKSPMLDSLVFPQTLKEHTEIYQNLQKQLNVLNAYASRINALRKELLKTEMRVRYKNKFFQRLSLAGDKVFPKRKELIKQISQQFTDDVHQFIKQNFETQNFQESFYILREEIKAFQGLAKVLTLNTHSFTQTRMRLSECWDRIKVEEKERKKERAQQRVIFRQNAEEIEQQIQALKEALEKNEESPANAQKKVEGMTQQMRKVELGREEIKVLREGLNEIRKMVYDKIKSDEDARQQQEKERYRQKKEKYQTLKNQAEQLIQEPDAYDVEILIAHRDTLLAQIHESSLQKNEKQELERILKPLRDLITEKKEKALLALSEDDRHALQQMQNILSQRKERRQEIKNQLEFLRKAAGSSSLDFEKAMNYTSQINEEKERLEKANQAIQEIEQKIRELQAKIRG
jgi:hypothetical protein